MMIDENRVIAKSKTYTKGFKGMAPTFKRGRGGLGGMLGKLKMPF